MQWKARVEATSFDVSQFPPEGAPEVAFAGRSNVGKSSLINALLGVKLSHVGGTPGKTRSINFYAVEADGLQFRLVDLPGYGYAARSKAERREWSKLIEAYVEQRRSLLMTCHLVDFRHGLLGGDRELQEWFTERNCPYLVVFTKADKIAKGKWRSLRDVYIKDGLRSIDVPPVTSADSKAGIDELRALLVRFVREQR